MKGVRPTTPAPRLARVLRAAAPLLLVVISVGAYLNTDHEEFLFDSAGTFIENPRVLDRGGNEDSHLCREMKMGACP